MKMNAISSLLSVVALSLISISASQATSAPSTPFYFDQNATTDNFNVRAKGWSDPAFGDLGWVHSSDWGFVTAKAGQIVTITMKSDEVGMHPAATVYYRGAKDTAEDKYVPDVALTQNASMAKWGAVDDATGAALGDIVMQYITHGYDADHNTSTTTVFKGKKDGVSGRLVLKFKAPYNGVYMFVGGGYNPAPTIDASAAHILSVTVGVADAQ